MKIKNIIQLKRRNNHKKKLKELLFLGDEFDIDNEYIRGHYYDFMINYKENEQYSTCGEFGKNPKWEMLIYNGGFLENFLSLVLTSSNINRFFFLDIFCLKFAVSISNKDYSNYYTKTSPLCYFSEKKRYYCLKKLFKIKELTSLGLMKNNKYRVSLYLKLYGAESLKKYIYSVKSLLNENKITINYEKNENEEKGKNKDNEDNEDSEDNENNEDNEDENDKDLYTVEDEDYYEFPIENINELSEDIFFSDNLYNGNYSWTLMVYPNGKDTDGNDYISIYLKSYDVIDLDYYHVCCNFIVTLRNYNNYSIYKAKAIPNDCYFSLNNNEYGFKYIKKELLTTKDAIFNRSILENDKIVIGIYMRILKYNSKVRLVDELRYLSKTDEEKVSEITNEYNYDWHIKHYDSIESTHKSQEFKFGGYKWNISLKKNPNFNLPRISISLNNLDFKNTMNSILFHTCLTFVFSIRNFKNYSYFISNESSKCFYISKNQSSIECLQKFYDSEGKIFSDNNIMINSYIRMFKYEERQYFSHLRVLMENNDDNSKEKEIGEDYYEWNIESWKRLTNSEKESIEFIALGYKWEITIFPDGDNEDSRGYISLNLKFLGSSDENNSEDLNMYFKYVLVIRNYKDYSCYTLKYSNTAINLSKEFNEIKYDKFFKKDENFCRFLIKDDKLTVGIIIKEFNYNLESFRNDIKKKLIEMDSYEGESCDDDFYEYELDNCDKLTINDEIISPEFTACGHKWKIILSLNSILYKGFASLMLKNEDLRDNQILFSKFVAYIRNYRSYSLYKFLVKKDFNLFTEKFNRRGSYKLTSNKLFFNNTIENNDEKVDKQEKENEKKNDNEDSKNDKEENKCDEDNINVFNKLIDNNKLIIGFYIKTFKNATLEQIMEKVMNYTSCDKYPETSSDKINYSEYFYEWEAEWDYNDDSSSYNFILRWYSYKWNVIINDNKFNPNDKSYISLYFKLEDDLEEKDEIKQSPVYVKYALYIRNSKKPLYEIKYSESIVPITKEHACRGFSKFILREDFFKLLENDRFIFGIYIHIYDNYDEEKNELSNEDEIIKDLIEEKNFGRDYNYTDPKKK